MSDYTQQTIYNHDTEGLNEVTRDLIREHRALEQQVGSNIEALFKMQEKTQE